MGGVGDWVWVVRPGVAVRGIGIAAAGASSSDASGTVRYGQIISKSSAASSCESELSVEFVSTSSAAARSASEEPPAEKETLCADGPGTIVIPHRKPRERTESRTDYLVRLGRAIFGVEEGTTPAGRLSKELLRGALPLSELVAEHVGRSSPVALKTLFDSSNSKALSRACPVLAEQALALREDEHDAQRLKNCVQKWIPESLVVSSDLFRHLAEQTVFQLIDVVRPTHALAVEGRLEVGDSDLEKKSAVLLLSASETQKMLSLLREELSTPGMCDESSNLHPGEDIPGVARTSLSDEDELRIARTVGEILRDAERFQQILNEVVPPEVGTPEAKKADLEDKDSSGGELLLTRLAEADHADFLKATVLERTSYYLAASQSSESTNVDVGRVLEGIVHRLKSQYLQRSPDPNTCLSVILHEALNSVVRSVRGGKRRRSESEFLGSSSPRTGEAVEESGLYSKSNPEFLAAAATGREDVTREEDLLSTLDVRLVSFHSGEVLAGRGLERRLHFVEE